MPNLTADDLRAAVAAGVIDEAAAARLSTLAAERQGRRVAVDPDDEPFEFFRGFGEIFIAVGLALALVGLHGVGALLSAIWDTPTSALAFHLVAIGFAWIASEYFARKRRMSLPSIVLAIGFSIQAAYLLGIAIHGANEAGGGALTDDRFGFGLTGLLVAVLGAFLASLYYWRFRLPFAVAPIGVYALGGIVSLTALIMRDPESAPFLMDLSFDLLQSPEVAIGVLVFGVLAFVVALRFDLRDPHRVSRHSACAFWLHVLAAPALVNTVCLTLYNLGGVVGYVGAMAAFGLIAALALTIDRRSFLMAGIVYAGLLLGSALQAATQADGLSFLATIGLLGLFMTVIGAKWASARGRLLRALPDFPGKDRLPPY